LAISFALVIVVPRESFPAGYGMLFLFSLPVTGLDGSCVIECGRGQVRLVLEWNRRQDALDGR
jgi:hypothetical protein